MHRLKYINLINLVNLVNYALIMKSEKNKRKNFFPLSDE